MLLSFGKITMALGFLTLGSTFSGASHYETQYLHLNQYAITLALTAPQNTLVSDAPHIGIGYPHNGTLKAEVSKSKAFWSPTTLEVSAPATVVFQNESQIPLDATFDHPEAVHADTARINFLRSVKHFVFPLSAEGNVAPFYHDTAGVDTACKQATYGGPTGTTPAADSICLWDSFGGTLRIRVFTTPGTYTYHTRFGDGGQIIIH